MILQSEIRKQLEELRLPHHSAVIMHSSLRAIGEIEGRAEGLLDVLIEYCKSIDTLFCVPTHTWCNFGKEDRITLDMTTSAEVCIGTFPKIALSRKDGIRTQNPTHSMVVFGETEKAKSFASLDDHCASSTAFDGCHGELARMGGAVLLVGVGLEKNTFMHSVEEKMEVANRMTEMRKATVKLPTGEVIAHPVQGIAPVGIGDVSRRFPKYEDAFRKYGGIHDGALGEAKAMLCDCRIITEVMEKIHKNSGAIELLADTTPLRQEWY